MRAAREGHRAGRGGGRDMSRLLSDFGHELPSAPPGLHPPKDARLFRHVPSRGARRRWIIPTTYAATCPTATA